MTSRTLEIAKARFQSLLTKAMARQALLDELANAVRHCPYKRFDKGFAVFANKHATFGTRFRVEPYMVGSPRTYKIHAHIGEAHTFLILGKEDCGAGWKDAVNRQIERYDQAKTIARLQAALAKIERLGPLLDAQESLRGCVTEWVSDVYGNVDDAPAFMISEIESLFPAWRA